MIRKTGLSILIVSLIASCNAQKNNGVPISISYSYSVQKKVEAEKGAVVSAHALASKVGIEILKAGGNAFDAAIATQLALAVVFPRAGNIGGGGFMIARTSDGKEIALDYREMAPGKSSRDMYLDAEGKPKKEESLEGHLASGVPGTVAGLFAEHKYAKLPFSQLIQPAIDLAENGFILTRREANSLDSLQKKLRQYNSVMPVFVKDGMWKEGDTLIQKDLANTLKRIRDKGEAGFYEGETARLIIEEMKRGGGLINYEDLKNYKAKFREPHVFDYKGYRIIGMPMPSSGGLLINQMMKMIEKRNIGAMGFQSVKAVQLMTEVERRAFADRGEYMGDADFYKVPVKKLVSDAYLNDRMKDFNPDKENSGPGTMPGKVDYYESSETTHFNVIDKDGNAVAITTTLNDSYGSKTVVGGAGFLLNDEMDDFSVKAGVPNMFGAIGGEANAIAPGKRMLSSMAPTIVTKDGQPFLLAGTPGGTTIPTSVFQTLVNIIEFGMTTEDAVYKPKFHHQLTPDTLELEKGFSNEVKMALQTMGYHTASRSSIGRTEVIKVLPGVGKGKFRFEAVADNREADDAEGW